MAEGEGKGWSTHLGAHVCYALNKQLQQVSKCPSVPLWHACGWEVDFMVSLNFGPGEREYTRCFLIRMFHTLIKMSLIELSSAIEMIRGIDESNAGHA